MPVQLEADLKSALGEGPSWDERSQELYWVDIMGEKIFRYQPETGQINQAKVGQQVGCVVPRKNGGLVLGLEHGFYFYDWETEQLEEIHDPESHLENNRFNDGKADPAGRLWAGTMSLIGEKDKGALYVLEKNLTVRKKIDRVGISNGLGWSPDLAFMYFIDSLTKQVVCYRYELETGQIKDPEPVVSTVNIPGVPDGMTVDQEGMLWIAHFGGSGVSRWDPSTGKQLDFIEVPVLNVTSCTFGGPDFTQLYITTARTGTSEEDLARYPHAGGLFRLDTNVKGSLSYPFEG